MEKTPTINSGLDVVSSVKVLTYWKEKEEEKDEDVGCWVALAIDMDVRGYGKTIREAKYELQDLLESHIGYAYYCYYASHKCSDLSMLDFPAEEKFFQMYEENKVQDSSYYCDGEDEQDKTPTTSIMEVTLRPGAFVQIT